LATLLPLLPLEFHKVHELFYSNMRGLSVAHYGYTSDPTEALELLDQAKTSAEKSVTTKHQYETDRAMLLEKIAEESEKNVTLTFGKRIFSITKKLITFGFDKIEVEDVHAVRWGMTKVSEQPLSWRFSFAFKDNQGTEIALSWTAGSDTFKAQQEHWSRILDATLAYVLSQTLIHFMQKLDSGAEIVMGNVRIYEEGVKFSIKGFIFTRDHFAPWASLKTSLANGGVVLEDVTQSKAKAFIPLATTDNAFLLRVLAKHKDS
jgi:hypothetical protein